jgi:hypothetical protein
VDSPSVATPITPASAAAASDFVNIDTLLTKRDLSGS